MTPLPRFLQTPAPVPRRLPEERDGTLIGWINRGLSRLSETTIERSAVVATLLLGIVDYALPPGFLFFLFYFAPITAAAWFARRAAYFIAFLAAGLWAFATLMGQEGPVRWPTLIWGTGVHLGAFLVVAVLTERIRQAVEIQRDTANRDWLTGLANSRAFREHLGQEIDRALRYGGIFTVAYLDLDNFKQVNDTRGHAEGDEVLRAVAAMLMDTMRGSDVTARLGGDEYGILLPETPYAQAERALEKLQRRTAELMEEGGWPTTASIGAVTFEAPVDSADEALRIADHLMYEAKAEGGSGIRHVLWTGGEGG